MGQRERKGASMSRPLLLDLFCGAGGAAMGYYRAGFDVIGVDVKPQPHYPFRFVQGDALNPPFDLSKFQAAHASPPCQGYSPVTDWRGSRDNHGRRIEETRQLLKDNFDAWVIENVPHAPLRSDYVLCGSMFGLPIRRHRWFETSWEDFVLLPPCQHKRTDFAFDHGGKQPESVYRDAMGCEWMLVAESREAIPPAYTEWIGHRLLKAIA